jgi:hypothetical protein
VSWLRWLATGISQRSPGLNTRPVRVGFVVDKVALSQVSLLSVSFDHYHSINAYTHSFAYYGYYINRRQSHEGGIQNRQDSAVKWQLNIVRTRKYDKAPHKIYVNMQRVTAASGARQLDYLTS